MVRRMTGGIGFDDDIAGLFTDEDRSCMAGLGRDLADWWGVRRDADELLRRIEVDEMPPPSENRAWSGDMKETFRNWIDEGCPKTPAEMQAGYFDSIDKQTEYEDPRGSGVMDKARIVMSRVLPSWKEYAEAVDPEDKREELEALLEVLAEPDLRGAVEAIDDLLCNETERHFADGPNVPLDILAVLDAFENFGRDVLPEDAERQARFSDHYDPLYHRMDSTSMWFNWAGHLECAVLLKGEADARHDTRTAMLNGLVIGCPMDFVFREDAKGSKLGQAHPRAPTLSTYSNNLATKRRIRRKARRLAGKWQKSIEHMQLLYRVYEGVAEA